jgi:hypothetical protein
MGWFFCDCILSAEWRLRQGLNLAWKRHKGSSSRLLSISIILAPEETPSDSVKWSSPTQQYKIEEYRTLNPTFKMTQRELRQERAIIMVGWSRSEWVTSDKKRDRRRLFSIKIMLALETRSEYVEYFRETKGVARTSNKETDKSLATLALTWLGIGLVLAWYCFGWLDDGTWTSSSNKWVKLLLEWVTSGQEEWSLS